MTKTFMVYSPDYDEACGACYRINQRLVRLSITDFDDCFSLMQKIHLTFRQNIIGFQES